ncbi:type II toxin-antitoxin system MqsA family antitoxin [Burkholderia thailandensis]|nr:MULTISPECIES: type II toxin-antitoxin system MqsA family antitoxin [Burkholderia]MCS6473428.1 type II toxin-antitoxin system MqsA family antitoxin [Burkholderia thailandensis]MCS6479886.1 type II toxin-antitoxin system MqsA family antitoxin [Burkholderia thailandensis]MCS6503089.1 type II toxin-antitoxin system MqsA family antitoxin [Burkholderia thailandensis]CAJ9446041.1 XRE family transcriptional regulator [Burkholderia pseudomallei]
MKHRNCANCGTRNGMTRFENESFTIQHETFSAQVHGLSGWRCKACDEVEFDPQSAMRYAEAGDALVLQAREHTQHEIRRIRKKLHLSQVQAARLTGGGHNAFSRYESGDATPVAAVVNLLKLLDRQPELLKVLVDAPVVEVQLNR